MTKETRGCWQKERTLGHGGFGEVTLWNNMETGKYIAIKTLQRRKDGDDRVLERWQTEVEILLRLDHNNVVKGFEVPAELQECDKSSMAMQYCSGGDLRQVISKPENRCGLPESDVRFIARDVSSAIEYLHSMKIIHRDLKPDNVVLQTSADVEGDCERIVYKLIDLGYAKDLDQDSVAKSFVGTWYYLAPELLESDRYTCTVDYWSFGIIMFEMMTGLRPFLQSEKPISKLWQDSVKNKRQEVIHIFFNTQAKVQCSDKIPSPNQLCRITRGYMEQWLQLMLLFEPVKRGGNFTVKKRRECFEFLDQILNIRLIHIFCVPSSQLLSYPLQSSHMPLPEVMTLVERETNIPVARQDLLLGSGMELNRNKLAQQCIVGDVDDVECPVFLFDKGCNAKELQWRPLEIPEWVKRILKEPTTRFTIADQKRAWYQALNFCRSAARNLKQLQNAQRAALLCLLRNNTNFMKLHQELTTGIVKFQAKLEFFRKSHELDLRRFEEQTESGIFSQRMHQSWKQAEAEVQNYNILEVEKEQLEPKCVSVSTMIYELQKSQPKQMDLLDKLAEEALLFVRQYQNVKQPITHEEIVTIVKKCQKTHEDVSNILYTCIGKICRCKQEMTQLLPLVEAQVQNIDRASNRLIALQSERQRNVWKLVEVALKVTPPEPSHPDSPGVNGLPMSQLSLSPVVLQRGREESLTAIREHKAVKDEFSSILGSLEDSSKTSLDWTFLDTLASQLPEDGVTGNT